MIQLLGQVVLSAVLVVWGYQVASRVRRRPWWLWPAVGGVVSFGFLALAIVSVAEGAPAALRSIAATAASVLYGMVAVLVLGLFVAVSRAATRPVEPEPEAPSQSMWEPKGDKEPSVIVDDEPWQAGRVIDAGTAPPRPARAYEDDPELNFVPPEEPVAAHIPDQEVVAVPAATLSMNSADVSPDDVEASEQIKPRRAMSPEPDSARLDEW